MTARRQASHVVVDTDALGCASDRRPNPRSERARAAVSELVMKHSRVLVIVVSTLIVVTASGCSTPRHSNAIPTTRSTPIAHGAAALEGRRLRLPRLAPGQACPAQPGRMLTLSDASGPAILEGPVGVMIPQRGNITKGIVELAESDTPGWYGVKTHWLVRPGYEGRVVLRARSLDDSGPMSILPNAMSGPLVIPPGPTSNGAGGWREQPSGTYVKGPGCYGVQLDGASFSVELVFEAVSS